MSAIETVAFCRIPTQRVDGNATDVAAEIRCLRMVFRTANAALDEARQQEKRRRKVHLSSYRYRDPKTNKVGRLYLVTVRPRAAWEISAEKEGGFGL